MRKCVSWAAVASAAVGLAGCSSPDRVREPAGAARPLGTGAPSPRAAADRHGSAGRENQAAQGHVPPLAVAPAAGTPGADAPAPNAPAGNAAPNRKPSSDRHPNSGVEGLGLGGVQVPTGTTPYGAQPPAAPADPAAHADPAAVPKGKAVAPTRNHVGPPPALPAPAPPVGPAPSNRTPNTGAKTDSAPSAMAQIMNAAAASQLDGKAVLLDFGADWCTACRALDQAMRTPKAQAVLAQSYHVVHIDLGSGDAGLLGIASQYDAYGTYGMPLLVVLNPDGSVRADSAHVGQPRYDEAGVTAWLRQWAPR